MPTVKLVLAYDGTRYAGWQVQPNGPSIQAAVERALSTLHREPVRVTGAGRTDAGVHALGQVASFPVERPLPVAAYVKGMNDLLPDDIAVREAEEREGPFDARRDARGKRYRYRIDNGPDPGAARRGGRPGSSSGRSTPTPCEPPPRPSSAGTISAAFRAADCEAHTRSGSCGAST